MLNRLCCFQLKTAAVIIGWLGCAGSVMSLALVSGALVKEDQIAEWIVKNMKYINVEEQVLGMWITFICVACLAVSAIKLVTSSLLILGTVKERHLLLLPWLIDTGLYLSSTIAYYVVISIVQIYSSAGMGAVFTSIIMCSIAIAIYYFIWYAMYSHYKQLKSVREQEQSNSSGVSAISYPSYTKI